MVKYAVLLFLALCLVVGSLLLVAYLVGEEQRIQECSYSCDMQYSPHTEGWYGCMELCGVDRTVLEPE
jgi:hypothetical protein